MAPPRIVTLASLSVAALVVAPFLGCERRGQSADARPEPSGTPPRPQSMAAIAPTASVTAAQSSIQSVRMRLKEQFEARSPELKDVAKLHAAWNEVWQSSFDAPLESATKSDVASGQVLPPEIITHL